MELLNYLPSLTDLFKQIYIDIGNQQIYWILVFVGFMLTFHGVYVLLVVIFFNTIRSWLIEHYRIAGQYFYGFRLAAFVAYFIAIVLIILGHLIDIVMWTYALIPLNIFPSNPETFYFAGEMYVTVGFGSFELTKSWRILPIVIAFSGIFAASMSGAALFNMLGTLISRASKAKDADANLPAV